MKEWWRNLPHAEKQKALVGMFLSVAALMYFALWNPLNNTLNHLREKIKTQQSLLSWMQETDQKINGISASKAYPITSHQSFLDRIHSLIEKSAFSSSMNDFKQMEDHKVQIRFSSVNFDAWIAWFIKIQPALQGKITDISIKKKSTSPGLVEITLTMTASLANY